ncbi:hypothetical protein GDI3604 [Gluconacetobacter diazotrophicus PA1 5]|uniref:Uncharacterized protein n=1 Tax=Gluconacetobacter diazotrophicus (strain ATCC 49037 / DSM 5601 / CCUG 37298 / CIP 103539 / LMG 7603 / PAl5) TaxID=272568 RepID=A9H6U0_GLUDA|nr:hypothetical protein GDI3604 [Gluconacetobacter diazotrophicus PA1 5]
MSVQKFANRPRLSLSRPISPETARLLQESSGCAVSSPHQIHDVGKNFPDARRPRHAGRNALADYAYLHFLIPNAHTKGE